MISTLIEAAFWGVGVLFGGGFILLAIFLLVYFVDYLTGEKWDLLSKMQEHDRLNSIILICVIFAAGLIIQDMNTHNDEVRQVSYEEGYREGFARGEESGIQQVLDEPLEFDLYQME